MNKAVLIGRLTRDVDTRFTRSGTQSANFALAVDRTFRGQDGEKQTDFINIVAWGKTAELCSKYIGKGSLVCVVGRIQVRNYEDNQGTKRYVTEIVAEEVQFLDRRTKSEGGSPSPSFDENDLFDDYPSEDDMPF